MESNKNQPKDISNEKRPSLNEGNKRRSLSVKKRIIEEMNAPSLFNGEEMTRKQFEIDYYGASPEQICSEFFDEYDDVLKNINYRIFQSLVGPIAKFSNEQYAKELLDKYFDKCVYPSFNEDFDNGQNFSAKYLSFKGIDQNFIKYVIEKRNNVNSQNILTESQINNELEIAKQKFYKKLREDDDNTIKKDILAKIKQFRNEKWVDTTNVKAHFKKLFNELKHPADYSVMKKNIDIMGAKIKQMKENFEKAP